MRPSLPGYGFSDKPGRRGWGVERIAGSWIRLMARLGYERYGAQGADWGTTITTMIGRQDPDHVAGIHLTPPLAPPDPATFDDLTDAELAALTALEAGQGAGGRLLAGAVHPAANAGLRTRRLTGGADGLDCGEVLRGQTAKSAARDIRKTYSPGTSCSTT